jgi:LacI family transcriptional regulator
MSSRSAVAGTVGIVGAEVLEDHSVRIVRAVAARLEQLDFRLVYYAGGFPRSPLFRGPDGAPRLPKNVNRFLILGEAMRGHESACASILDDPARQVVTLGGQSKLVPSVSTLEEMGIWQAVGHLVRHHNRKSVAFLAGTEDSCDTELRLAVFKSAVEGFGVSKDPNLILRTPISVGAGREGVRELLRRNRGRFDALAAASDVLAIGAIEGLRDAGLRVPQDVSVIGFGDVAESAFLTPTLSTVHPPFDEYAGRAVASLLAMVQDSRGEPWETPSGATLRAVLRESCGCKAAGATADVVANGRHVVDDAMRRLVARHLSAHRRQGELAPAMRRLVEAENLAAVARELSVVQETFQFARVLVGMYSADGQRVRIVFSSEGSVVVPHMEAPSFHIEEGLPNAIVERLPPCSIYVAPLSLASENLGYIAIQSDLANADDACRQLELARSLSLALSRVRLGRELARLYDLERQFDKSQKSGVASSTAPPPPPSRPSRPSSSRPADEK